ncbi:hypothetical protein F5X98DRAFT_382033 [Xylaria grammica]|nr:hypothetical protein F5X98DRAFT_382033 [Xylaria grammica]
MSQYIVPNTLIGGRGGSKSFYETKFQTGIMLRRVEVWYDSSCLRGLRFTWADGTFKMYASSKGNWKQITFAPGELCRELVLWGNGIGTRTGRIRIVTDKQTFECGKNVSGQDTYPMNIGSGLLVGFQGACGTDIDRLSPLFLKVMKSLTSNVTYSSFPTGGIIPVQLDTQTFNARGRAAYQWEFSGSRKRVVSNTWSQSSNSAFGLSMKIQAGIPEVASIETGAEWSMSNTSSHSTTETQERELGWSISGVLETGDTVQCTALCQEGKTSLDYTSQVTVTFKDGKRFTFTESGNLDSISVSDCKVDVVDL